MSVYLLLEDFINVEKFINFHQLNSNLNKQNYIEALSNLKKFKPEDKDSILLQLEEKVASMAKEEERLSLLEKHYA